MSHWNNVLQASMLELSSMVILSLFDHRNWVSVVLQYPGFCMNSLGSKSSRLTGYSCHMLWLWALRCSAPCYSKLLLAIFSTLFCLVLKVDGLFTSSPMPRIRELPIYFLQSMQNDFRDTGLQLQAIENKVNLCSMSVFWSHKV